MRENNTSKFTVEVYGKIPPKGVFKTGYNIHIKYILSEKKVICLVLGPNLLEKRKIVYFFLIGNVSPFAGFAWFLARAVLNMFGPVLIMLVLIMLVWSNFDNVTRNCTIWPIF